MKLINRNTDYAVRALSYFAQTQDRIVPVGELVDQLAIPRPFLRKILQILHQEGQLLAYKGRNGGFKLAYSPNRIFLADLIAIFQGPLKLNECIFKKRICPEVKVCRLRKQIALIEQKAIAELKRITIKSLLNKGE